MNRHTIRTSKTDSVKGLHSVQNIDVNLKQTTKTLPFPNVSTVLSQRTVYEEEREAANKFRLILTIVPYCTNVLFNPLTEIIKNEGGDEVENKVEVVTDNNQATATTKDDNVIGQEKPSRIQMIANTEYSSSLHGGYEYHPGYDFFDNHVLRNQSFKIVNQLSSSDKEKKRVFNTIEDFARDKSGTEKKYAPRYSIEDVNANQSFSIAKHLYRHDDILEISDSINQNLYEENGWWGFTNNTVIPSKELNSTTRLWDDMDISHVLNYHKSCEFIDMYPDRSLYSFTPKYNKFTHEEERNWNVVITYPYKNIYDHPICLGGSAYMKRSINSEGEFVDTAVSEGNRWMGIKIMTAKLGSNKIGGNCVLFRTYTKHGLSQGDTFYLYYTMLYKGSDADYLNSAKFSELTLNNSETYYETEKYYKVTNTGDTSKKNHDYYFYTSNTELIKELYRSFLDYTAKEIASGKSTEDIPLYEEYDEDDKKDIYTKIINGEGKEEEVIKTELINKILKYTNFRFRRCVSGVKSTYYLRLFRKIPNLRAAKREMTDEEKLHTSKYNGVFDKYVMENASDPVNNKYQRLVNSEQYQMAFASNIFNDNISQITFIDGIDTENLTDNLGRPLSELYYTFVKNNAGHEAWYLEGGFKELNITKPIYSNKGLETLLKNKEFQEKYGADYKIEYSHCFGKVTSGLEMFFTKDDTEETTAPISYLKKLSSVHHISNITVDKSNTRSPIRRDEDSVNLDDDITYKETFFYGDLVEFNAMEFQEKPIANIMHRFNTAQRELINNPLYSKYRYHEITEDDFDPNQNGKKLTESPFEVTEYSAVNGIQDENSNDVDFGTIGRPEGYIYKAHYPIQIREYSSIQQGQHYTLRIRTARPVQKEGILIQVTTLLRHGLSNNDIIFICDDASDTRYITRCVKVIDSTNFLMSPDYTEIVTNATDFEDMTITSNIDGLRSESNGNKNKPIYKNRYSWLELCNILNGEYKKDEYKDLNYPTLILRRKNSDIPDYATYIGGNRYLWRDLLNIGDNRVQNLPDYIFANGYFYVTTSVNFFLKRQDPYGNNGLYHTEFPNDPSGSIQAENNYVTKDPEASC